MKWAIKAMCTFVLLFLSMIVVSATAHAQTFRGTILGTVIDESGAAIPGAQIGLPGPRAFLRHRPRSAAVS